MTRLVIAISRSTEERLIEHLLADGVDLLARIGAFDDVLGTLSRTKPDVLLADADAIDGDVLAHCDELGIRPVVMCGDEGQRRSVTRLGILDVLDQQASARTVCEALVRPVLDDRALEPAAGRVTAVWGPAGAPGRTTVAISLAVELAHLGAHVALIDADTWSASIAQMLGMLDEAPGFAAACRLAGQETLTIDELERLSQRYAVSEGRLSVLTGLTRSSRWPELTTTRVTDTIAVCRSWVDHVIIDTGFSLEADEEIMSDMFAPRRNAATLAALRASDAVIGVGRADPIGISRYLRQHSELLEAIGGVPVRTVMNRVRSGPIGIGPGSQIASTLQRFGGITSPTFVANDERAADAALLEGRSMREVAPRSPAAAALRELARSLAPTSEKRMSRRERRTSSSARRRRGALKPFLVGRSPSSP